MTKPRPVTALAGVVIAATILMTLFELAKDKIAAPWPGWAPQALTIGFATILVAISSLAASWTARVPTEPGLPCERSPEVTADHVGEEALRAAERRYHSLFESMTQGFAYCSMVYEQGRPTDFVYLEVNRAFETLTGLVDIVGRSATDAIPGIKRSNPELFETYGRVASTGVPERFVTHVEPLKRWFDVSVYSSERGRFVAMFDNITERKSTERALHASEERYRLLFERNLAGVYRASLDGRIIECNESFARILGYGSRAELFKSSPVSPFPSARARDLFIARLESEGSVLNCESEAKRQDGEILRLVENATLVEGNIIEGTVIDLSDQRRLEEQFRQAQKMEAIGRLAGGIAHDFNNLLGVIVGYGGMVLKRLPASDPLHGKVEQIVRAADRAADLTRQLLAFSRQQVLQPRVLDLNLVVSEMDKMLRRVIGEDVELATRLGSHLGRVKADRGQLEQILMNLAVNARDAMPEGGQLTIETQNAELDDEYASGHLPAVPGSYVMLAISDTGVGMDEDVRAHIFEPFFTTKGLGKGTGLGLSTVYGIVKQSGGYIWVYSETGIGTTFKVYLPRVDEAAAPQPQRAAPPSRGSETVLLVEDEPGLRQLLRETLDAAGYTTLVAQEGAEALQVADIHQGVIHLLVTDVVMPGMKGQLVASALRRARPGLKVLYISGYTDEGILPLGILGDEAAFLSKPFAPDDLLRKIRDVLGETQNGAPDVPGSE